MGLFSEEVAVGESEDEDEPALRPDDVEYKFFVRTWPEGWWKLLHSHRATFDTSAEHDNSVCYGTADAFGLAWDDVRLSPKYSDATGSIVLKVVARRYREK